jgi:hypothetical protein
MDKRMKPIMIFGYVLIFLGVFTVAFGYLAFLEGFWVPRYFVSSVSAFYFLCGVGVVRLTGWGYYLFRAFLYVLFLAVPIGTMISLATLKYMKRNNIKHLWLDRLERP